MKKIIFGIFAHPDDEAFGPAGTLLFETRSGSELHLISLTNGGGELSNNPDHLDDLGAVRLREWQNAGDLLGARSMNHLGYTDGKLNNEIMIEAGERIMDSIRSVLENEPADTQVEFITLDLNGLTGHIDHIVASRAACLAFYRLKADDDRLKRIRFYCLSDNFYPAMNTRWIFMEKGRTPAEINETTDNRSLREDILAVMNAHHSQREDANYHITLLGDKLGVDHFIIKE